MIPRMEYTCLSSSRMGFLGMHVALPQVVHSGVLMRFHDFWSRKEYTLTTMQQIA